MYQLRLPIPQDLDAEEPVELAKIRDLDMILEARLEFINQGMCQGSDCAVIDVYGYDN